MLCVSDFALRFGVRFYFVFCVFVFDLCFAFAILFCALRVRFCFVFCVRVFACDVRARFCLRCACADLPVLCERNFGCALCDFASVVCVTFCFVLCVRDFALRFVCAFLFCVLRVRF